MDTKVLLEHLLVGNDLQPDVVGHAFSQILGGHATPAQVAALLIALRAKGESAAEIAAAAQVMRELCTPIHYAHPHLVDTCGTGGGSIKTFNVSTAAAFVAAAAGCKVAKHGNRSASSRSGSADLLEAAGVRLDLTPQQVEASLEQIGVGFLYAPAHHSAMRHVAAIRKELGVRTIFNLLGPLTNPAHAPQQVIGVFARRWADVLAEVLSRLDAHHVLVVHADDGLDEISIAAPTYVAEWHAGTRRNYTIAPEDFGMARAPLAALAAADPRQSLVLVRAALVGTHSAARDIVALNAGAAIYAAGVADSLPAGVTRAIMAIADGSAQRKFDELITFTQSF